MVMARKDKQVQKDAKVPLENVIQDNSHKKETSQNQLKATISKFGDAFGECSEDFHRNS